ncbi:acetamidase/formamidase family protein [Streptomyces sp. VRA16 Mangrove soil]|uniref:acetamidase/formamidase family protein n=1 Tax=Streptomyces sp. VRA16 Mangrove soil TaxID=2817434 RepID=UPI001A9DCD90|nr:acetamidase/formamidase family protein [Streptomyces sp. VRA16 Mangrove soil]MBO1331575.1 acetamidase/formamidase family protein [Streptomyces sp. VRA16 Mangrove soil]
MTLEPGQGPIDGTHYLEATPENVLWGRLPCRATPPALTVDPGCTVTFDTVSHEGILADQGSDPVEFFGRFGVAAADVLSDARLLAKTPGLRPTDADGPHVVSAPVHVRGAAPGDLLRVDILSLHRRADYGLVSSRHGRGALPDQFAVQGPEFTFCSVENEQGVIRYGTDAAARFPLRPFLGIMGVATDTDTPAHSVPPGRHGGNIDVKHLGTGTSLYLPVQTEGAGFHTGDPHYAQGNGEVALTAFEAPLRATLRLTVLKGARARAAAATLAEPFGETDRHWIPIGLHEDLNLAMKAAVRSALAFLTDRFGMPPHAAYAYLSAAADFEVSQVVDRVQGVHCLIRKSDFS